MTEHEKPRRVLLGQIGPAHGVRGEVTIRSFTADPRDIAAYGPLTDKQGQISYTVKVVRVTAKGVVCRITGIDDRNAAEAAHGLELYVDRHRLPDTLDQEFYHADLVGLTAVSTDGAIVGRVIAVQNFGAGDLLEIHTAEGRTYDFIPFTKAQVPDIDLAKGEVTIRPLVMTGDDEREDTPES
jgi:16S rRNA processing protein RimM